MEIPGCPHLPPSVPEMSYRDLRELGADRGPDFYRAALTYGQCLWQRGLPAQAILQLDRAWGAELRGDEAVLDEWPSPFRALGWILEHRAVGGFFGNPVRHFQHLATRVRGERREPRSWRAWACLHLAEDILPPGGFPRDLEQIAREGIAVPEVEEVARHLGRWGWPGECEAWWRCGSWGT